MAKTKIEGPKPWFKFNTHLFHSDAVEDIWELEGRNQHKILLLLIIIESYITFTLRGEDSTLDQEFELNLNRLVTLSHLNKATIISFIKELKIFGIDLLQHSNKVVTITYNNYVKLQNSGKQIREDKIKEDKITLHKIREDKDISDSVTIESDISSSNVTPTESLSENKKEPLKKLTEKLLSEGQLSVLLSRNDEGDFRWLRNSSFDIVADLQSYFPDLKEDVIRKEINNLAIRFKPDKFKENDVGYMYIYNCLGQSLNRKKPL